MQILDASLDPLVLWQVRLRICSLGSRANTGCAMVAEIAAAARAENTTRRD